MRRLTLRDLALLLGLGLPWALALALHAQLALDGRLAWAPLYVEPARAPAQAPVLRSLWPETPPAASDLEPGDALLAAGDTDLRGAGRLDVLAAAYAAAGADRVVPFVVERAGARREARLALQPLAAPWRTLRLVVALGASALLALWRGRARRAARAYAAAAFAYALTWAILLGGPPWQTRFGFWLLVTGAALFPPLGLRAFLLFPEATAPRARAAFAAPWLLAIAGPLTASWLVGAPLPGPLGLRLLFVVWVALLTAILALVARNYWRADATGRRQLRWVGLGFYLGLAPMLATALLASLRPELWRWYEASLVASLALPVCIAIALVRDNLFDVDRLISSTAAYTLLSVLFVAALLTVVPRASHAASRWVELDPGTVQTVLALAVAAVLVPAERVLRPRVEQLFFRERHVAERGLRALRAEIGRFPDAGALLEALGARLAELLALETCAIYGRSGDLFAPLFARGAAIPPAFAADGPLALLLEQADDPVGIARWARWRRRGLAHGADDAALQSLDAQVLLPIRRGEELAAFVCLGAKRSEDVYTPVELTLLDGVADRVGGALLQFDARAVERAERERHERLVGYVPAAVRAEIERQALVEAGEQDVSILFVDIRGYTGFSESRSAGEVFRVVNAYTTAVSAIVRDHGGQVVEFHGDGLLAVFGAPAALADKERAALATARAVVAAVDEEKIAAIRGLGLRVGVGVATGETYVGSIESADRKIWTVIGNTTNLAARLQALTRDLGVSVVVDETTFARAGDAGRGFARREDVRVRGRSEALAVYVWPAGAA